jgi:hypothetical protein
MSRLPPVGAPNDISWASKPIGDGGANLAYERGLNFSKVTHAAFESFLKRSPEVDQTTKKVAEKIMRKAREIFINEVRHTHPVTPPPYAESFKLQRIRRGKWRVVNTDPAALWVEFGAHAGGVTMVLGYRPLGRAVDAVQGGK